MKLRDACTLEGQTLMVWASSEINIICSEIFHFHFPDSHSIMLYRLENYALGKFSELYIHVTPVGGTDLI